MSDPESYGPRTRSIATHLDLRFSELTMSVSAVAERKVRELVENTRMPRIYPDGEGGLQLEYGSVDPYIEIYVDENGKVTAWLKLEGEEYSIGVEDE